MPRYSFECNACGVKFEAYAPFDEIRAGCPECGDDADRDFCADLESQSVMCDDSIRKAYLGSAIDHNLAAQGRPMDPLAPKDKFEAKHVERATGRQYIGNDVSKLSAKGQKAILNGERRPGQSRPIT